jgi:hypothetical protein
MVERQPNASLLYPVLYESPLATCEDDRKNVFIPDMSNRESIFTVFRMNLHADPFLYLWGEVDYTPEYEIIRGTTGFSTYNPVGITAFLESSIAHP